MKDYPWRFAIIVIVGILLLTASSSAGVMAQGRETAEITGPTEGSTVSGQIIITGTIDFPDFMKYELFLKTGEGLIWAATVYAPVINGNLARLDTRTYADGIYQLIIRTVRTDSNYNEYTGPSFIIDNGQGAPLPYPEIESSFLYQPVAGAIARVKNCGGDNLGFTYGSPQGFCSADDLWLEYKPQDSPICPYVDILLIPCEYRGTAQGEGQPEGTTYSFVAEKGKIYELIYTTGKPVYIAEIEGDERASADTGDLDREDPARSQAVETAVTSTPESAAAPAGEEAAPTAAPTPNGEDSVLPVSGQGRTSQTSFIVVALGFILLLIVGGVVAIRKRAYPAAD
jgi:hypothetical protein